MVSEPCGRGAGVLSPQRDAPVTASGCKQHTLPQHRGCIRKDAVNQGGTTEVCYAPVLAERYGAKSRTGAFFMLAFTGRVRNCAVRAVVHFIKQ